MSELYQITKQLHETIQNKAKELGKKFEIKSDFIWLERNGEYKIHYNRYASILSMADKVVKLKCLAIEVTQIREVLIALQDILGENPELEKAQKSINTIEQLDVHEPYFNERNKTLAIGRAIQFQFLLPKSQSEALCKKWLDGLTPLIDSNPIQVLTELNEILTKLKPTTL